MKLKDYNRIDFKRVYLYCQVNRSHSGHSISFNEAKMYETTPKEALLLRT